MIDTKHPKPLPCLAPLIKLIRQHDEDQSAS